MTGWFPPSKPLLGKPEIEREGSGDFEQRAHVYQARVCVCATGQQVVIVAVAVGAGAAVGAAGPLPLPGRGQHGQLRRPDGTLADDRAAVARVPVLGRAPGPLGGSGHLLVLLGEENGRPPTHFWSQS